MSEPGAERFDERWLALREVADARARSAELAGLVAAPPPAGGRHVVHDLGCGTGSMGRWLVPRLAGPQHWVLRDRDPDLLARAAATLPPVAADGAPVTVETRQGDVTALTAEDLAGASLVTASALLDLLTLDEVRRLAAACTGAGCPALLVLSVRGRVELAPAHPLDAAVGAAFNAHQRRLVDGRRLLGPDAVDAAVEAFTRLGARVEVRESPWQLGPGTAQPGGGTAQPGGDTAPPGGSTARPGGDTARLMADWLRGWVAAAAEHEPTLPANAYLADRLPRAAAGALNITVHHADLLAGWEHGEV